MSFESKPTPTSGPGQPAPLLGDMLLAAGHIEAAELERALDMQARVGGRIGALLMRLGAVSEDTLLEVVARQTGMPLLLRDLPAPDFEQAQAGAALGPGLEWLLDQRVLLWVEADTGAVHWSAKDPMSNELSELLALAFPTLPLHPTLARGQDLDRLLDELGRAAAGDVSEDMAQLRALAEEAPVVELVGQLLAQAVEQRASDIHIEPDEHAFVARFRIDGVLHSRLQLPAARYPAVASRIKLISGMDIAERRLPQDGRLTTRVGGQEMDVRVSALPGIHGESLVLRLLPKQRRDLGLDRLGMEPDHLALMRRWAQESNGIILVTGPTGSGKSTTLYGTLAEINDGLKKIITAEDPVEYQLPGITQIQVHADIGLTFASALRSILRQDPDVIMIGEIRDLETAQIAVQASLTGHLVLSTLHTNDALSAFGRLVDMGLEPYLVGTPIKGVQAQRLVRRLCGQCSRAAHPPQSLVDEIEAFAASVTGQAAPEWRESVGCPACQGTGYRGRLGIYELVPVDEAMQQLIINETHVSDLRNAARMAGIRTLRQDGLLKAWRGITSIEEVLRVVGQG